MLTLPESSTFPIGPEIGDLMPASAFKGYTSLAPPFKQVSLYRTISHPTVMITGCFPSDHPSNIVVKQNVGYEDFCWEGRPQIDRVIGPKPKKRSLM